MMRAFLLLLVVAATVVPVSAQQSPTIEQRLGATIGSLIVENSRLAIELDAAKQTIAKLQAELDKAKANQEAK